MNAIQLARIAAAVEAVADAINRQGPPEPTLSLGEWLISVGKTHAWLAEHCGVGQATVSRWIKGTQIPTLKSVRKVYDLSGGRVGVTGWPRPG